VEFQVPDSDPFSIVVLCRITDTSRASACALAQILIFATSRGGDHARQSRIPRKKAFAPSYEYGKRRTFSFSSLKPPAALRADGAQAGVASVMEASFDVFHQSISSKGMAP
jgi:hypothetical protein